MKEERNESIDKIFEEGTLIDEALRRGVADALLQHKRAGNPIVVWRDNALVWLTPEEIPILKS